MCVQLPSVFLSRASPLLQCPSSSSYPVSLLSLASGAVAPAFILFVGDVSEDISLAYLSQEAVNFTLADPFPEPEHISPAYFPLSFLSSPSKSQSCKLHPRTCEHQSCIRFSRKRLLRIRFSKFRLLKIILRIWCRIDVRRLWVRFCALPSLLPV